MKAFLIFSAVTLGLTIVLANWLISNLENATEKSEQRTRAWDRSSALGPAPAVEGKAIS